MKRLVKLMSCTLALVLMVCSLAACKKDDTVKNEAATYVSLRINPEIELIANEDDVVIAVNAINEDGEVVLSVSDFIGDTVEEASEEFVDAAVELGYIDVDSEDSTVYVHVDGDSEKAIEDVENKINKKVHDYFDNRGIFGKVMKENMEEYLAKAEELGISVGHVKMIERILELYPELTEEELLDMKVKELMELLKSDSKKNGLKASLREEYKAKVEELKTQYSEMFAMLDELRELEKQLEEVPLTDAQKAIIESRIIEIKSACDIMKETFDEAVKALKDSYKEQIEDAMLEFKNKAKQKKLEHASKLEKHLNHFKKNKEEIKNKIKSWRERFGK